jgi:hypothetical protein
MTEDTRQKEIRLKKELAQLRAKHANEDRVIAKNRDFSMGTPADTSHKAKLNSNDCPDVVLLPKHRRGNKENIPF